MTKTLSQLIADADAKGGDLLAQRGNGDKKD